MVSGSKFPLEKLCSEHFLEGNQVGTQPDVKGGGFSKDWTITNKQAPKP